jgi:hypothetical protein
MMRREPVFHFDGYRHARLQRDERAVGFDGGAGGGEGDGKTRFCVRCAPAKVLASLGRPDRPRSGGRRASGMASRANFVSLAAMVP